MTEPHRTARKLGEHPLPPPAEPPMAATAPERLTAFLYLVARDLLPARYVENITVFVESDREVGFDAGLRDWAERMARRLCFEEGSPD